MLGKQLCLALFLSPTFAQNSHDSTEHPGARGAPVKPTPASAPAPYGGFSETLALPFVSPLDLDSGLGGATDVAAADLDGDGVLDLVVAEGGKHADDDTFAWYEGPAYAKHHLNPSQQPGPFVGAIALADVNGDGRTDVVAPSDQHNTGSGNVYWFENPEEGAASTWPRHTIANSIPNSYHFGDVDVGDLDGDGRVDAVARHLGSDAVRLFFQDGPLDWSARTFSVPAREGMSVEELDGDGRPDLLLNGFVWFGPDDWREDEPIEVVIDATYFSLPVQGLNNSTKGTSGDVNGDGRTDVLLSVAEGSSYALAWFEAPQDPRSGVWTRHVLKHDFTNCHQALLRDLDGDGDLDVAGGYAFGQDGVFLYRNLGGAGLEWKPEVVSTSLGLYSGGVADLDGDGALDLFGPSRYAGNGKVYLYFNESRR